MRFIEALRMGGRHLAPHPDREPAVMSLFDVEVERDAGIAQSTETTAAVVG